MDTGFAEIATKRTHVQRILFVFYLPIMNIRINEDMKIFRVNFK